MSRGDGNQFNNYISGGAGGPGGEGREGIGGNGGHGEGPSLSYATGGEFHLASNVTVNHYYHTQSTTEDASISSMLDDSFSESEIYCHQLLRRKRGFPLYDPTPQQSLPQEYQIHGVAIGDVGSISPEGSFDFFFNIYLPANHPINNDQVPEMFCPLPCYESQEVYEKLYGAGDHVSTSTMERLDTNINFPGGDFIFNCHVPQGAVLVLPHGSRLCKLRNLETVRTYAATHAENWFKYINGPRGRGLNGPLHLVTGCEKAPSWGLASCHGLYQTFQLSFKPTAGPNHYKWIGNPAQKRYHNISQMHDAPWNQTTFIHVLCISLGTGNPPRPVETVQIRDITMESRSESSGGNSKSPAPESSLSSWFLGFFNRVAATDGTYTRQQEGVVLSDLPPISQIFHPGELINNYILKKVPEARVVMSHDDDWSEILGDDDPGSQIQTISELLQRISDQYEIVEKDGANFLHPMSLADAVQQNHAGWSKWPKNQPEQGGPQWAFNESNSFQQGNQFQQNSSASSNLARTDLNLEEYQKAKEAMSIVLEEQKQVLGDNHPDTLHTMCSLASTYSHLGEHQEAKKLTIIALEKQKEILGDKHPSTQFTMGNLASIYSHLGEYQKAQELNVIVLENQEHVLGSNHPDTLNTMGNLASTFSHLGEHQMAKELYVIALEKQKQVLGDKHPDTLHTMGNLASTFSDLGEHQRAKELNVVTLEKQKQVLGNNHPDTLHTMGSLASTYLCLGEHQKAKELTVVALEKHKQVLGDNHPDTLHTMKILASTYSALGEHQKAKELDVTGLEKQKQVLGDNHPETLHTIGNLASTYSDLGEHPGSRELDAIVLGKQKQVLGNNHPDTLHTMGNLASTYSDLGEHQKAKELDAIMLEEQKQILGVNHPHTVHTHSQASPQAPIPNFVPIDYRQNAFSNPVESDTGASHARAIWRWVTTVASRAHVTIPRRQNAFSDPVESTTVASHARAAMHRRQNAFSDPVESTTVASHARVTMRHRQNAFSDPVESATEASRARAIWRWVTRRLPFFSTPTQRARWEWEEAVSNTEN